MATIATPCSGLHSCTESELVMNDKPNLDDSTASDIVKAKNTFEALATYCELRLAAMDARFDGDIEEATRIERTMERIYKRLPEWARW